MSLFAITATRIAHVMVSACWFLLNTRDIHPSKTSVACTVTDLRSAGCLDKGHKLGVVVQDQAAQSVLHHEPSHNQEARHFAEAVGLVVALIQVVPAFACTQASCFALRVNEHRQLVCLSVKNFGKLSLFTQRHERA